jgi:MFS family permease
LYHHYGFTQAEIGQLFLAGFGSSLLFGTVVGAAADRYGRRTLCLLFGALYSISCLTKHSSKFEWLLVGRVLGGISTSILFSAFESWMVAEHHESAYPEEWLRITFSVCTSGNGVVAIVSGVSAGIVVDAFGPVAPFDLSLIMLLIGSFVIATRWKENYGDVNATGVSRSFGVAMDRIFEDRKILLLGIIQSFFEGSMYVFVFMWTPALESTSSAPILHGWVFASFMICVLIGSSLFEFVTKRGIRVEEMSVYTFGVACTSLLVAAALPLHSVRLLAFFVFEVCCGAFWPSIGVMRSRYVPEEVRATVMNLFRVPLNLIVVFVLSNISRFTEKQVLLLAAGCLVPAFFSQLRLRDITDRRTSRLTAVDDDDDDEEGDGNGTHELRALASSSTESKGTGVQLTVGGAPSATAASASASSTE